MEWRTLFVTACLLGTTSGSLELPIMLAATNVQPPIQSFSRLAATFWSLRFRGTAVCGVVALSAVSVAETAAAPIPAAAPVSSITKFSNQQTVHTPSVRPFAVQSFLCEASAPTPAQVRSKQSKAAAGAFVVVAHTVHHIIASQRSKQHGNVYLIWPNKRFTCLKCRLHILAENLFSRLTGDASLAVVVARWLFDGISSLSPCMHG